MLAMLNEFMDEQRRIPTPADDGFSGRFAREIVGPGHDERL
jgi:hypothetical protein